MTISVVISTHNRSGSLGRTLNSVKSFADEIIVVDSGSSDDTVKVAKNFTKKVFSRPNNLMLNVNKNFGFSKASGDWILCLDDDEDMTAELAKEIRTTLKTGHIDVQGYWIPRKNIIFGRWIRHGLWWPDRQLRLFKNGYGKFPEKHVHEYISVTGRTETIQTPYIHHNYDSIGQYLNKMQEIYTESEIQKYEAANYRVNWQDAIRFPASDFFKIYFAQEGYKDGLHGLVLSILQSFYSFIIFAKLWERAKFREEDILLNDVVHELQRSGKEFSYWAETSRMKEAANPLMKLWHKVRRRYGRPV
jgi:glycosyltransferase involved in cell wall biosynthesis